MTPEQVKALALSAMHKAIQDIDDTLKVVRSSGQGGAIQFRLADAKQALEDLLPSIDLD